MTDVKEIAQDAAVSQVARQQAMAAKEPLSPEGKNVGDAAPPGQDVVQVNQNRRDDAILEENARLLLKELPDVRPERVAEARRRLESGFYDDPEVLNRTAEQVQPEITSPAALRPEDVSNERHVQTARRRLARGYYEQPEVLDETARKIVKNNL